MKHIKTQEFKIRTVLLVARIFGLFFLLLFAFFMLSIVLPGTINIVNLLSFVEVIVLFLIAILLLFFTYTGLFIAQLVLLSQNVSTSEQAAVLNAVAYGTRAFFEVILFNNIKITTIEGFNLDAFFGSGPDPLAPLSYLLLPSVRQSYELPFMKSLVTISFCFMLFSGINFLFKWKLNQATLTFFFGQLCFLLSFLISSTYQLQLDASTISSLVLSSLFQFVLVAFFYLEYAMQTEYFRKIAKPTLDRHKNVSQVLEYIHKFALTPSTFSEKGEGNTSSAPSKHQTEQNRDLSDSNANSQIGKKTGKEIQKLLLETSIHTTAKDTKGKSLLLLSRLQRYYASLAVHDKELNNKLLGSEGKRLNPFSLLSFVFASLLIKTIVVVLISWIILNASVFFSFLSYPLSIVNSVEFSQPESIVLVLLPLVFFVVGISFLFSKLQKFFIHEEELIIQKTEIDKIIEEGKTITSKRDASFKKN